MQKVNEEKLINEVYRLLMVESPTKLIDIINQRMDEYSISQYQLGKVLSIGKSTFNRLIDNIQQGEIKNVDFFSILKIAQFLNISMGEISQFYVSSLKPELIAELESSRKANFLHMNFDLKGLKSIGFINDLYDVRAIESRLVKFFGLSNIFEYNDSINAVFFSKIKRLHNEKMREFWVRSAYHQFQKIDNPNEYSEDKLRAMLPKIRPYTRHEEKGLLTVCQALYNIGITVIVQSYLPKTCIRGGCFVVNGKPCIMITDYNDSYATLWFALLHELYHVLYDFEELRSWSYHLTGEQNHDLFKEDTADFFACELLFPKEKLNYIQHMITAPELVKEYAEINRIHPSIIYSFYCFEQSKQGNNVYHLYKPLFGNPEKVLRSMRTNPFDKETILEEVIKIKTILEGYNK